MIKLELSSLAGFFKSQSIDAEVIKESAHNFLESSPLETLFLYLGESRTSGILKLRLSKQAVDAIDLGLDCKPNLNGYYHLQLTFSINTEVKETHLSDLGRFILLINRLCTLPGFELDEINKTIDYRYTTLISGNTIDPYILISMIGTIMLFITTFETSLRKLALGELDFAQSIEELKNTQDN